ncbi:MULTISPECIES: hypothetical protein [Limnospira]|uniref:Restriction endonuclease n=1 Tax=Limnospira platensis NIES-46 TaxID=1236695 RepID=A0A5M3T466_LIMPL|nr:hypothetical protein [Arthrospira platensis]MDF2208610.1 restriction endonuclease [Arthrospira platensis NCB002]MDT9182399.1 restriction endonuclease [Limnospira sp. PMC 289.06]MDT9294589.1 restriction endonuclease [Arthrospira platensis PCC 7345]BAI94127.1 hypothetical protein NIES39_Q01190 [Arthrospira platensis NIES-39]BDT16323.1 hypothetical protein N39L_60460 [Arthrospira platensis NIES-39]
MPILQHDFTLKIIEILNYHFPNQGDKVLINSEFLPYLNIKTKAANRGSKSRAGFANHYAIYVLVEDYLNNKFHIIGGYDDYEGAQFINLLQRQRQLPFGNKLQNHALNHRLNQEFKKYFPTLSYVPVIRDTKTNRYWINENLLQVDINGNKINIAEAIIDIIDAFVIARRQAFSQFIIYCKQMIDIQKQEPLKAIKFIRSLLNKDIDARVFEMVSYAILKQYYGEQKIYWGWSPHSLNTEYLILYKTGRTNANDGGIDFVMKPLGRFFQVTETIDAGKYFLDIDKVQRYPITFVVKTEQPPEEVLDQVRKQATAKYNIKAIVQRYLESIEEVINIPELMHRFDEVLTQGKAPDVIEEIVIQSRIEFNLETEENALIDSQDDGRLI